MADNPVRIPYGGYGAMDDTINEWEKYKYNDSSPTNSSEETETFGDSLKDTSSPYVGKDKEANINFTASVDNFRRASLNIPMLGRQSDIRKASTLLAGWNVINLIQGTGILGVPYAVQQGGWAAVFMIFFVALLCCHTGKLIVDCMYETCTHTGIRRRFRVNYPEIGEACFGHRGLMLVGVIQSIEMFSAVIMYLILLGTAWVDLFKMYGHFLGLKEWAAISCLVILPSLFITRMSIVSWLSMFSVISLICALLVLIASTLTQVSLWDIDNIPAFNLQTFPIGFGIIVFSYCAHAVFPSIEGSMKRSNQFNCMMNCSFVFAAVIKACLGTLMVLRFGKDTAEVATVNLADQATLSIITTSLIILNVILAVPLAMFVVSASVDDAFLDYFPHLSRDASYHWIWLLITRPTTIAFALFIAVTVPFFGLIMGVVGCFTGSCLCFIFPCMFHIKLRWETIKKHELVIDISIICFGIFTGITGLYFSMKALAVAFIVHHNI